MVELELERHELEAVECREVTHGHDVVEPEHPDPPPCGATGVVGDQLARAWVEELLERGRSVLTDVAGLLREDDEGITVGGKHDVRVPVDDLEPGHVRDSTLEAAVLAPGHDQRVEIVLGHRGADVRVTSS